ncbi:MAG: hypothetical protein KJ592_04235 [Nanoarchaeota archaeon]|nr:hypothetical protein [Nanoarchaeota archaeon]
MVSVTVSVSDVIRETMKAHPEVNWSGLVRRAIVERAEKLMMKKKILERLDSEKDFDDWAVGVVREGRR